MRGRYRKIDNEVLQDPRWEILSPNARLIKFIADVSPRQTACGVLRASISALALESGLHPRAITNAIDELVAAEFIIKIGDNSYYVPTFFKSNCSSDKFASQALKEVEREWPTILEKFLELNGDIEALKKARKENSSTADERPLNDGSTHSAFSLQHSDTDNSLQHSGDPGRGNGSGVIEPPYHPALDKLSKDQRETLNSLKSEFALGKMTEGNATQILRMDGLYDYLTYVLGRKKSKG